MFSYPPPAGLGMTPRRGTEEKEAVFQYACWKLGAGFKSKINVTHSHPEAGVSGAGAVRGVGTPPACLLHPLSGHLISVAD